MRLLPATHAGLEEAARLIRSGRVVAYPTETVYGLGVDPFSRGAISALFEIKGRAENQPVLLVAADEEQVRRVASNVSATAAAFMRAFWPGPLSLALPKTPALPDELCAGLPKVCVRIPACETARSLCRLSGMPITSTSANRSGEVPARMPGEIMLPGVEACIDGGKLEPSLPSTVFDPDSGEILREGAIDREMLRRVAETLGLSVHP